jgi:hypothetical protein
MTLPNYNSQFLDQIKQGEAVTNNATPYGVQIRPVSDPNAQKYWRVVGVHHLTGSENMGNHHVYVDVLDEEGRRINGSRLILTQDGAAPVFAVVDKPANEAGTNFPMWSSTRATVAVQDALPSEAVMGLRSDHADEGVGNTWGHHSFYIVFQRATKPAPDSGTTTGGGTTTPEQPEPEPQPQIPSLPEVIAQAGQPLIIPLNPDAGFYKFAKQQDLGERLTREYDVEHEGRNYRAQIYEKGIVYAEVGDWGNIKIIPRTN